MRSDGIPILNSMGELNPKPISNPKFDKQRFYGRFEVSGEKNFELFLLKEMMKKVQQDIRQIERNFWNSR